MSWRRGGRLWNGIAAEGTAAPIRALDRADSVCGTQGLGLGLDITREPIERTAGV